MAKEIQFTDATGLTDYVNITSTSGLWYNTVGAAFEAFNAANFTDYDIAATEFGTTGVYSADMPTLASGLYNLVARRRAGGSPAVSDLVVANGEVNWTGSAVPGLDASVALVSQKLGTYTGGGDTVKGQLNTMPADTSDKLLGRNLAGGSDGGRTVQDALRAARNKVAFDVPGAGQFTVFQEDDLTPAFTGTYSVTVGASPVTTLDPA